MQQNLRQKQSFTGQDLKSTFIGIIIVANSFIWYLYSGRLLSKVTLYSGFSDYQTIFVWGLYILGTVTAAVLGFTISNKAKNRISFLRIWMSIGVLLSLLPLVVDITELFQSVFFFTFAGIYFGLGMPVSLAYFAVVTKETNRSRWGGITFLSIFAGVIFLGALGITDIALNAVILAVCKLIGLIIFLSVKPIEQGALQKDDVTYGNLLGNRAFILYFVPWMMFSVANYLAIPIVNQIFSPDLFEFFMLIENIIAGVFAVISGFLGDYFGRKRLVVAGFVLLGFGYASLGLFPQNIIGWWFYTVVDGIAWGIFYTIFLMTIWGDIAKKRNSEKFYAIGYLPFLLSIFTQMYLGTAISSAVDTLAIFSFTSLFLFLAVLPLAYAPETLPSSVFKNRELKDYLENASRMKEKG
jgi:MFS family permease